jgi:hypothetical protein
MKEFVNQKQTRPTTGMIEEDDFSLRNYDNLGIDGSHVNAVKEMRKKEEEMMSREGSAFLAATFLSASGPSDSRCRNPQDPKAERFTGERSSFCLLQLINRRGSVPSFGGRPHT